jgi:hypothetical protein
MTLDKELSLDDIDKEIHEWMMLRYELWMHDDETRSPTLLMLRLDAMYELYRNMKYASNILRHEAMFELYCAIKPSTKYNAKHERSEEMKPRIRNIETRSHSCVMMIHENTRQNIFGCKAWSHAWINNVKYEAMLITFWEMKPSTTWIILRWEAMHYWYSDMNQFMNDILSQKRCIMILCMHEALFNELCQ